MIEEKYAQAVAKSNIRFIRDIPADDDFFNLHTRVAESIVRALEGNSELKVIGLLGRWGSGKSTVANKIVALLEDRRASGFRVFTYDAWLHQSDPLRRSFLESLISNLVSTNAIAKQKWTNELEKLSAPVEDTRTIETPVLSHDARWIGLSLLAVPVGLGLVDLDVLKEAFGSEATTFGQRVLIAALIMVFAPALTWTWLYLKRRPWKQFFSTKDGFRRRKFWRLLDENGNESSALQIFVGGQAKHTTTQTFRSIEPTSLEFGRMFQEIMREAAEGGHRLIILIDNLDRVAEEEALGMWATIRSFFLASHETEDVKHEPFHPTVILPIDRHAVEELFAGSDTNPKGGRDRARSFMDKTFDVTFEVTEPVNSDWREFLAQQMRWMFRDVYQPNWGFWTRRLFESQLVRQRAAAPSEEGRPPAIVTPREINKLLNRIGTLYLQWVDMGIPVEVMALYVIRRDDIDRGILPFLQSNSVEIADVAPDWKRQIAALHYGVELTKAAQVLLEDPIRTAIIRRDSSELKSLSSIPGFREIFEYATSNLPEPSNLGPSFDILANAVFLLHSLNGYREEWSNNAWRNLVSQYIVTANNAMPTPSDIAIIKLLSEHVVPDGREAFVTVSARLLSRLLAQSSKSDSDASMLRTAADDLIQFAAAYDLTAPLFDLQVEPKVFITRLSELSASRQLWPLLRTIHGGEALSEALIDLLGTKIYQTYVPNAVRCFTLSAGAGLFSSDVEINFKSIAAKANELVRAPENFGGNATSGIRVLAELSYGQYLEGKETLTSLVDEGVLATRLNEAADQSNWNDAALIIAILLWRGNKFSPPSSFIRWDQYQQRDPDSSKRIINSIHSYFPGKIVSILWSSRKSNYSQSSFVESIIGYAVDADALGKFDAAPVLENLHEYKYVVPYRHRDKFLEQVDRQSNFLGALEEAPLGPQIAEAAGYLMRKGGADADRANTIIRSRVEHADAAAWLSAIRLGQEPYGIGRAFIQSGDLKFGRKNGLYDALRKTIPDAAQSGGKDMRERWFTLVELMKADCKRALLQALGEATGRAPSAQALNVLKTGGVKFLRTGGFVSRANQSVHSIIIPQLEKKDGRNWLKDNRDELAGWIQRADPQVRDELASALNGMFASRREERRYTADILATKWDLKPST